jgi:hypothetical protein
MNNLNGDCEKGIDKFLNKNQINCCGGMIKLKELLSGLVKKKGDKNLVITPVDPRDLLEKLLLNKIEMDKISRTDAVQDHEAILKKCCKIIDELIHADLQGIEGEILNEETRSVLVLAEKYPPIGAYCVTFEKNINKFKNLLKILIEMGKGTKEEDKMFISLHETKIQKIVENIVITTEKGKTYAMDIVAKYCLVYKLCHTLSLVTAGYLDLIFFVKLFTSPVNDTIVFVGGQHGENILKNLQNMGFWETFDTHKYGNIDSDEWVYTNPISKFFVIDPIIDEI